MTYNASSRKDIRAAEKLDKELHESNLQFLRAMMDTTHGRRWLYHHLAECQCFVSVPSFSPNHDYFDLGRKSIGLPLMANLQTECPNQYMQMIGEENVRLAANAAATQRSRQQEPDGRDPGRADTDDSNDDYYDGATTE